METHDMQNDQLFERLELENDELREENLFLTYCVEEMLSAMDLKSGTQVKAYPHLHTLQSYLERKCSF